jgi:hypothetical protein
MPGAISQPWRNRPLMRVRPGSWPAPAGCRARRAAGCFPVHDARLGQRGHDAVRRREQFDRAAHRHRRAVLALDLAGADHHQVGRARHQVDAVARMQQAHRPAQVDARAPAARRSRRARRAPAAAAARPGRGRRTPSRTTRAGSRGATRRARRPRPATTSASRALRAGHQRLHGLHGVDAALRRAAARLAGRCAPRAPGPARSLGRQRLGLVAGGILRASRSSTRRAAPASSRCATSRLPSSANSTGVGSWRRMAGHSSMERRPQRNTRSSAVSSSASGLSMPAAVQPGGAAVVGTCSGIVHVHRRARRAPAEREQAPSRPAPAMPMRKDSALVMRRSPAWDAAAGGATWSLPRCGLARTPPAARAPRLGSVPRPRSTQTPSAPARAACRTWLGREDAADGHDGSAGRAAPPGQVVQALRPPRHVLGGGRPDRAAGDVARRQRARAGQLPHRVRADAQRDPAGLQLGAPRIAERQQVFLAQVDGCGAQLGGQPPVVVDEQVAPASRAMATPPAAPRAGKCPRPHRHRAAA